MAFVEKGPYNMRHENGVWQRQTTWVIQFGVARLVLTPSMRIGYESAHMLNAFIGGTLIVIVPIIISIISNLTTPDAPSTPYVLTPVSSMMVSDRSLSTAIP
ncbi:hypothetical protein K456DRAFT_38989 [Colletotrichum gloeosporioides 23]|nr:hypothetical protein K456DRAFT_38989 [Colletotrichum gloeosporioides 23]